MSSKTGTCSTSASTFEARRPGLSATFSPGGSDETQSVPSGHAGRHRLRPGFTVAPIANCHRRSLRPSLGTTIASRGRAAFRQTLLAAVAAASAATTFAARLHGAPPFSVTCTLACYIDDCQCKPFEFSTNPAARPALRRFGRRRESRLRFGSRRSPIRRASRSSTTSPDGRRRAFASSASTFHSRRSRIICGCFERRV